VASIRQCALWLAMLSSFVAARSDVPASMSGPEQSIPGRKDEDPWKSLQHKSGWVLLGVVYTDTDDWSAVPVLAEHSAPPRQWPRVPVVGDVIQLKQTTSVVILDYRTTGELRRLDSPAMRSTDISDTTDVLLEAGRRVQVAAIQRTKGRIQTRHQGIWARVVPVSQP
jgi:hypothetical protein